MARWWPWSPSTATATSSWSASTGLPRIRRCWRYRRGAAAQRELQEEIGCRAGHLDRLSGFYVSPGYCSELIHMFLARDLSPSRLEHDDDEDIVVVPLSLAEALDKVRSGEIDDAKSIIGLLLAAKRLRV